VFNMVSKRIYPLRCLSEHLVYYILANKNLPVPIPYERKAISGYFAINVIQQKEAIWIIVLDSVIKRALVKGFSL
jgi:hypothetical protein